MLMDEDEDPPIPITGKTNGLPEDDGSHMNSTTPEIHKTNIDTT